MINLEGGNGGDGGWQGATKGENSMNGSGIGGGGGGVGRMRVRGRTMSTMDGSAIVSPAAL